MKVAILSLLILLPLELFSEDVLKREDFVLVLVPSISESPLAGANGSS